MLDASARVACGFFDWCTCSFGRFVISVCKGLLLHEVVVGMATETAPHGLARSRYSLTQSYHKHVYTDQAGRGVAQISVKKSK